MTAPESISSLWQQLDSWWSATKHFFPSFVIALLIQILFIVIAKISKKISKKILFRFALSISVIQLIANIISLNFVIIGLVVALSVLNLDKPVTSLLAGAGIIGLALGFAFQDLASNIISGVLLTIRKPFQIGDLIETNNIFGEVLDIRLRTVEIHNRNGQIIFIPSKDVLSKPVINFSRMGKRRIVINSGVSFNEDLKFVKDVAIAAVNTIPEVLHDEPIEFFYKEFGESSINFMVRFWINFERQKDYRQAVSDSVMIIKSYFDANKIRIPYPVRTLERFDSTQTDFRLTPKQQPGNDEQII